MAVRLGGRYEIVREIGSGGMGRVFEAIDTQTGRMVAAKVMIAGSERDVQALLRFQQEGAVLSTLKHPNIVAVYGSFLEEETCSIIMELVEGSSLDQLLRGEEISLSRAKTITEQVLSALAYAHSRGIVHRDIKPDNIMVAAGDRVKVTDFGIARILAPGATLNTRTGTTIGTPLYMSPEQIEGRKVDGRSDLYSLGTVMYQMVTGRPPFEGDDPLTVAFQHVHRAPQPPHELTDDVPEDWEQVILHALAKNPADRFQTADAMGSAVSRLSTTASATVPVSSPSRPPDTVDRIITPEVSTEMEPPRAPDPQASAAQVAEPVRASPATRSRPVWHYLASAGVLVLVLAAALFAWSRLQTTSHAAAGTLLASWGGRGTGPGQLTAPGGITIGPNGNVYVADYDNNRISEFTPTGKPVRQVVLQDRAGVYLSASGVAVGLRGALYVVTGRNRVLKFSPSGRLMAAWGARGEFSGLAAIAIDRLGNLYVVDQGHNRIVKLSPHGQILGTYGTSGSALGQFNYPVSVAVDWDGNMVIGDQANYRVQLLSPAGKPLTAWGSAGKGPGQFESVAGVAIDAKGNVYVADSQLGRIQEFTPGGKYLAPWGEKGSGRDQLNQPVGVAIDNPGNVYVVDEGNNRVEKFAPLS